MSKPLSRHPPGPDDAPRAAVRRAALHEGKSPGDWSDETTRNRAQAQSRPRRKTDPKAPPLSSPSEPEERVAEIARRLQQRRGASTRDELTQSLAMAGRRLAEARAQSPEWQNPDAVDDLRREIVEMKRIIEAVNERRSGALQGEINALLVLLDHHIDTQRLAGVSQSLLAPAVEIVGQLRQAVANLDPTTAIKDIRTDLDLIGRRLDELCGPNSGSSLAIRNLSRQIGDIREQVRRISDDGPLSTRFEAGLLELARHVCMLAESGALAQSRHARGLEALSRSISELVAAETDRGIAVIRHQISAMVDDFVCALDRAGQKNLVEMDARLRIMSDTLSQSLSQRLDEGLSRHAADTAKLQSLTEALALKIDAALSEKSVGNNAEPQVCEPPVVDLVGRLEAMQAALAQSVQSGVENRQADLAQQIDNLALRIDRALDSQDADTTLLGLEKQIEKLAERLDLAHGETLKMAETIARQAGEAAAQATLEKGNSAQQTSEQKETRETLRAVEEWLARIGERFATVEGAMRQLQEGQIRPSTRNDRMSDAADFLSRVDGSVVPTPVVEALAIPMTADTKAVDARATQAGFIAAARRAAQQTARRKWAQNAQTPPDGGGARTEGKFVQGVSAYRRPALITLGAIMLLVGAYQLTQNVSLDDAPQATVAQDTSSPVGKQAAENAADTRAAPSKQASAVDPAPVGAIVNPGQSSISTSMNNAMALATLAANGDIAAQFELASRYADGRDIVRDPKLAILWFEKAAQQGLAPAQYRLGTMYEKGLGAERSVTRARDLYQRAAEAGNIRAMHNLAVMLAEGGDGKPDYAAAAVWFRKAADFGVRDSQYNLAILYARGLGVETSLVQSYLWFSAAAAQGDVDAEKKRDEVAGRLGPRDLETAKALAAGFYAKTPIPAANDVAMPPGGWRPPSSTPAKAASKPKVSWFQSF